jgi:pimeloyl-ACP methyl ester carboxylesterase
MRICQCLFLVVPGLLQSCLTSATPVGPLQVQIESGTRTTSAGDTIAYDLFVPVASEQPPQPPWPAVVLNHGFARSKETQYNNALYMAQRGIVVLTPNQVSLLTGKQGQLRNIANTVDHVQWLNDRTADPSDPLAGQIDSNRIGLAGHSAGGAISFEAAIDLQNTGKTPAALVLLDAVPWNRTLARAGELVQLPMSSLRSEPSSCNSNGAVLDLLNGLAFPVEDVLIIDGTHCDPENPTDGLCNLPCGQASPQRQAIYQRLMYLFFQDAFGLASAEQPGETYEAAVQELESQGQITVSAANSNP